MAFRLREPERSSPVAKELNSVLTVGDITVGQYGLESEELGWYLRTFGSHSPDQQCWYQNGKFYRAKVSEVGVRKMSIEIIDEVTAIEPERDKAAREAIKKCVARPDRARCSVTH